MKKNIPTQSTVHPDNSVKSFNMWQKHLQKQLDKIKGTNVATKYKTN